MWHQGSLVTNPVIAGATTSTINQLNGGNYTLVLTRTDLGCAAPPATATVTNTQVLPVITTSQTPSTNCVVGKENGVADVTQVNGILSVQLPTLAINGTQEWVRVPQSQGLPMQLFLMYRVVPPTTIRFWSLTKQADVKIQLQFLLQMQRFCPSSRWRRRTIQFVILR